MYQNHSHPSFLINQNALSASNPPLHPDGAVNHATTPRVSQFVQPGASYYSMNGTEGINQVFMQTSGPMYTTPVAPVPVIDAGIIQRGVGGIGMQNVYGAHPQPTQQYIPGASYVRHIYMPQPVQVVGAQPCMVMSGNPAGQLSRLQVSHIVVC